MSEPSSLKTADRDIGRGALWNFVGQLAPLIAAIFSIPFLIKGLGTERFGVLTLAWMIIGYFSLFDLGLGRALIKILSEKLGAGLVDQVHETVWTAIILMGLLGLVGLGVTFMLADWLVSEALNIPSELKAETMASFRLLAWSVPIVIITTGLRGVLEAYQRFDLVNLVRIPLGIFTFLTPAAFLFFTERLDFIVLGLLTLRIIVCLIHLALCTWVMPDFFRKASWSRQSIRPMLSFGGWMTVTNVVGPLMIYLDRFIIGGYLSMAAVAYYVTPYEVVTKLLLIPGALVGVLFPVFSAAWTTDRPRVFELFSSGMRWILISLFPATLFITVFANELLTLWLSKEFAQNGTDILQWLAAGVFINGLAYIAFAFIQAAGRADLTAKIHLAELPLYLVCLWGFVELWGVVGVAVAWTLRTLVDLLAMSVISGLIEKELRAALKKGALIVAVTLFIFAIGAALNSGLVKFLFSLIILISFVFFSWCHLLSSKERNFLKKLVN